MKPDLAGLIACAAALLASCAVVADRSEAPAFAVTAAEPQDAVTIVSDGEAGLIEVESPSGIGSARVELVSGGWPARMIARLHLKGLEEFRLLYADTVVAASAASGSASGGQRILSSGTEQPIGPGHPLWLEIRIVAEKREIPLEGGYFEVAFPGRFAREAGSSFEIQWVDFFRQ
jgi:hypothetical protein